MKLFLPVIRDRLRLLNDWPDAIYSYDEGRHITLPAGSIVSIEGVKINKTTKTSDTVALSVRVFNGDPRFTMKKYGGKAPYGYRVVTSIDQLRTKEFELVEDMP